MKGKIKAYSASVKAGVIDGHNGKKYLFRLEDWLCAATQPLNQQVSFEENDRQANRVAVEKMTA